MKRNSWSEDKLLLLQELYPMESNVYTAAVLQMSASAVFKKAKEMGLMKVAKSKTMERAEYISKHFHDSSYAEMAEKLGVSKACVYQCARQLGLERNKAVNASVASRVRKELLQRERRRVIFGLDPLTKIQVVSNRAKSRLRSQMKQHGYIVDENKFILYYTESMHRLLNREQRGQKLGLRFLPLPIPENKFLNAL